jgi:hypothetical protein
VSAPVALFDVLAVHVSPPIRLYETDRRGLDEYAAFGIPHIWVIDPRRKKAFTFEGGRLQEVEGGAHTATAEGIRLPLEEAFRGL